jgi:hypothetical protein
MAIIFLFCKMLKLIIWGFVIYLIYKFVFELVLPVTKATSQMKDKLREMQQQQQAFQQQQTQHQQPSQPESSTTNKDDYIDFEEIK